MKDQWSDVEYEVVRQVTNGVPSYEIKDLSSNVKVTHHNRLFLLGTPQGEATPLCESKDAHISVSTQSALAELTPLECENDSPENSVEWWLTHHPTSLILLGWVDDILKLLPMVVPRSAYQNHCYGMKDKCDSDDEVH